MALQSEKFLYNVGIQIILQFHMRYSVLATLVESKLIIYIHIVGEKYNKLISRLLEFSIKLKASIEYRKTTSLGLCDLNWNTLETLPEILIWIVDHFCMKK